MARALVALMLLGSAQIAHADTGDLAPDAQGPDDPRWHRAVSLGALVGVHAAAYGWSYLAWYRGRDLRDHLELADEGWFGAGTYAGGADKLGHGMANYAFVRGSIGILDAGGWDRVASDLVSLTLTTAFFTMVELKDGAHEGFGFSIGDLVFNLGGSALGLVMARSPGLDRLFDVRLEYLPTREFVEQVRAQGVNVAEDYSGMSFSLVFHPGTLGAVQRRPRLRALRFLDVSLGYETRGYLPEPIDPMEPREQRLFIGVSFNLQGLLREHVWASPIGPREVSWRRAADWTSEIFTVPYTTLRVLDLERARER